MRSDELNYYRELARTPWILDRRSGLARGVYNRSVEGERSPGQHTVAEEQWRLNAPISGEGCSAYRMVFGSNPAVLFGWEDKDGDLLFAQDTSRTGQFAQQWKLRRMAQEEA